MDGRSCVLIVDDEADQRAWLAMLLECKGYAVTALANGAQAINWLRHHPPPALILLDLNMPVMNGREFCAALRHEFLEVPVVLLSGEDETVVRNDAGLRCAPASLTFVQKPAAFEELLGIIARFARPERESSL
jgi:CheY-like chemotaxis protein